MTQTQLRIFDTCLLKEIEKSLDLGEFRQIFMYFGLSL